MERRVSRDRVLNYVAFAALMATTAIGLWTLWGVLFLYWTVLSLRSGLAFLLTDITREADPILFWLIQIAWLVLGLLMIAADFFLQIMY